MRKATITCYNFFTHKIHLSKCFNLKINIKHFHLSHIQNIVDLETINANYFSYIDDILICLEK